MLNKLSRVLLVVAVLALVAGCCGMHARKMAGCEGCPHKGAMQSQPCCPKSGAAMAAAPAAAEQRADVLYSCNCGPECKCNSLSKQPGDCACGKPMIWGHVVRVEGDEALICTCDEGCRCALDPQDPGKCGCGKEIKRVSLKGSGLYFCNCGGACSCNTLSTVPGDCKCGMPLKQI